MVFEEALLVLKDQGKITRTAWANKVMFIQRSQDAMVVAATLPSNIKVEWKPTLQDLFALDWEVV